MALPAGRVCGGHEGEEGHELTKQPPQQQQQQQQYMAPAAAAAAAAAVGGPNSSSSSSSRMRANAVQPSDRPAGPAAQALAAAAPAAACVRAACLVGCMQLSSSTRCKKSSGAVW
jgi:hypothetical protein